MSELLIIDQMPVPLLSTQMQTFAQMYVDARRQQGEQLLVMARAVALARQAAQHGEWGIWLEATQTSERTARRMIAIHNRASISPRFAEAVKNNWFNATVAALLAEQDDDEALLTQLLALPAPPTTREAQVLANPAALPDLKPAADEPAPALPAPWQVAIGRAGGAYRGSVYGALGSTTAGEVLHIIDRGDGKPAQRHTEAQLLAWLHSEGFAPVEATPERTVTTPHPTDMPDNLYRSLIPAGWQWLRATLRGGVWVHQVGNRRNHGERRECTADELRALLAPPEAERIAAPAADEEAPIAPQHDEPPAPSAPPLNEVLRRLSALGYDLVRQFTRGSGWPYYEFRNAGDENDGQIVLAEGELAGELDRLDQAATWRAQQRAAAQEADRASALALQAQEERFPVPEASYRIAAPAGATYEQDTFEQVAILVDDLNGQMSAGDRPAAVRTWLTLGELLTGDAFSADEAASALPAFADSELGAIQDGAIDELLAALGRALKGGER